MEGHADGTPEVRRAAADAVNVATWELGGELADVRTGRRFVTAEVEARGATGLVDDTALVVTELLANAHQHGTPPIVVRVAGDARHIRVEVQDASARLPMRPAVTTTNMTGRGLSLVASLSARWGAERLAEGGKVVWAELDAIESTRAIAAEVDVDAQIDALDEHPGASERYTVVLGNVPTDLLIQAKAHVDNLVREFSLASAAEIGGHAAVPPHLAELIRTVTTSFSDARDAIKRQALASARRGDRQTTLTLSLPLAAADAGEAYLTALDEADQYSRAARLLTLETPPDHRLFRRWYVEAVVRQLRAIAAGQPPEAPPTFQEVMVGEIRRLSAAQRATSRVARLQRVTSALARARTPEDVATVVVAQGAETLDASGGVMLVPASDGVHLALPGVVGYGEEQIDAFKEERLDAPLPAATALRTGEPVWLETPGQRDEWFPALVGFEAATAAICAVPLIAGGRTLGALRFSFANPKLFDSDERAFVLALAAQTAQTLLRTEMYEAERQATLDLQRALLPAEVPAVPGWDIAAYYSPAGDQEAGGDFYDVLPVDGDSTVVIIGDVMGRGLSAAAAMAEVRSTIRAYAVDDSDPCKVFERVDRFFEALALDQLVTALYFVFHADSDEVQVINAGHLPPLLVDASGSHLVTTPVGTPFGVGGVPREAVKLTLRSQASIVAVTDGLVERRGEDIDEGMDRMARATHGAVGWPAARLLHHVVTTAAAEREHDDDVTVVVLRRA